MEVSKEPERLQWLRDAGIFGSWAANVLLFLANWWGIGLSAALTAVIGFFDPAVAWLNQPAVYVPCCLFIFFLWTYVGISAIRDRRKVKTVRVAHDCAYGLILDGGWKPAFGKTPGDQSNPSVDALTIRMNFRNVSHGPLKVRVEDFRVVFDGRSNQESQGKDHLCSRLSQKAFMSGAIPWDKSKKHGTGTVTIKLLYGPLDTGYERRYTLKLDIQIAWDDSAGLLGVNQSDEITFESDDKYRG